ncbi:MAG: hypothetical protein MK171_08055 [Pirellulales bacterium]|nr:hypothetical protein [Pirellulales bacterium]
MSRSGGTIAGIILLIFGGLSVSSGVAQEGRASSANHSSITGRLGSLRDSILHKVSEPKQTPPQGSRKAPRGGKKRPAKTSGKSPAKSSLSPLLPKLQPLDLLSESLFGRKPSSPRELSSEPKNRAAKMRAATRKRAGSISNPSAFASRGGAAPKNPSTSQARRLPVASVTASDPKSLESSSSSQAKRSPVIGQEEEIDGELADLQEPDPEENGKSALAEVRLSRRASEPNRRAPSKASVAPAGDSSIDLRQVLLDEVQTDAEATSEPDLAPPRFQEPPVQRPMPESLREVKAPEVFESDSESSSVPRVTTKPNAGPPGPAEIVEPIAIPDLADSQSMRAAPNASNSVDRFSEQAFLGHRSESAPTISKTPEPARQTIGANAFHESYWQPVIVSHVEGPRSILVGHEASYQVTLENTSHTTAEELTSVIHVPAWAEVVAVTSSRGEVQRTSADGSPGALEWKLSELAGNSSQSLRLRIIPRSGRPLNLGVEWKQAPGRAGALVEVQEPKLEISLSGPEQVLFGKPQRYVLILSNPGTGPAENITVQLIPPGGTLESAASQHVGGLGPGEQREIELELTAREAGQLSIDASATAAGGLDAEAVKKVLCLKPELLVDCRGPQNNYAGTVASYYFRVKNPGTATTDPVEFQVKIPADAKVVAASEGHSLDAKTGVLTWRLTSIDIDEEQFMQVRCELVRPGENEFELTARTDSGDLQDMKRFQTKVVAFADLKLSVSDPPGPSPVGESVTYDICVRNRGKSAAENVSVVGLFSEGIDPTTVEGAEFSTRDGRVTFRPIRTLQPDDEVRFQICATATRAGTHVFRAEAICREMEIKLAVEETTRFYEDECRWDKDETPYAAEQSGTQLR